MFIHIEICIKRVIGLKIFHIITLKEKSSKFSSIFLKTTQKTTVSSWFFFVNFGWVFKKQSSGFYNVFFNRANPGFGAIYLIA